MTGKDVSPPLPEAVREQIDRLRRASTGRTDPTKTYAQLCAESADLIERLEAAAQQERGTICQHFTDAGKVLPEAVREQLAMRIVAAVMRCVESDHEWAVNAAKATADVQALLEAAAQQERERIRHLETQLRIEIDHNHKLHAEAQQERARLADIFNTTETDVWRAHEVRDFLLSQNLASHPPPTPEDTDDL